MLICQRTTITVVGRQMSVFKRLRNVKPITRLKVNSESKLPSGKQNVFRYFLSLMIKAICIYPEGKRGSAVQSRFGKSIQESFLSPTFFWKDQTYLSLLGHAFQFKGVVRLYSVNSGWLSFQVPTTLSCCLYFMSHEILQQIMKLDFWHLLLPQQKIHY